MVPLATACSNCLLKDKCRQPLLRYRVFWFLVERKRLYSALKKVDCGDLHLFSHHNLVIRRILTEAAISLSLSAFSSGYGGFGSMQFYVDTMKQMALHQLVAGSPLRPLCLLIAVAGQPAEVFSSGTTADT